MKSVVNPISLAQLAMGPAGWASLALKTLGSAIGQQLIQQLGQQLGLPQSVIGLAQNAFGAATGTSGGPLSIGEAVSQLASQFNLSPAQQGQLERSATQDYTNLLRDLIGSDEFKAAKTGGSGKGFLERIAVALGKMLDEKMNKVASLADQIGQQGSANQSKLGELNGKMAAASQEVSILSQALNTTIKTIGEAQSTIARKG
ncbi:hypothetical protein [Sphingomonas guangdongensis]|uniref:hypothetical protein n=1 Tax=Sphingomonas guangdongensis TaxID=1141890 RepID=UPI001181A440|nr:hypothetical protein [Sphingomonas guangdongensis]